VSDAMKANELDSFMAMMMTRREGPWNFGDWGNESKEQVWLKSI
jgi:hypothetical protein